MKIVFFGSAHFAVPALKALLKSGYSVPCVVTQPDRKRGRGLHLASTAVKEHAEKEKIKVFQPEKINSLQAKKTLECVQADLFVVIAYGQILAQEILDLPKIFALNIHGSLLPKYRGAAPINWALIKGEAYTGVTAIKMTKEMDAGPMILQSNLKIQDSDTAVTIEEKLSHQAADLLLLSIAAITNDNYKLDYQDESLVTFAPRLQKSDGEIHWNKSAAEIHNLIRGCLEWPGAFTCYHGRLLKIYKAEVVPSAMQEKNQPGEIIRVSGEGILVAAARDNLLVKELQLEGKRRMQVEEFVSGHKIIAGEKLCEL